MRLAVGAASRPAPVREREYMNGVASLDGAIQPVCACTLVRVFVYVCVRARVLARVYRRCVLAGCCLHVACVDVCQLVLPVCWMHVNMCTHTSNTFVHAERDCHHRGVLECSRAHQEQQATLHLPFRRRVRARRTQMASSCSRYTRTEARKQALPLRERDHSCTPEKHKTDTSAEGKYHSCGCLQEAELSDILHTWSNTFLRCGVKFKTRQHRNEERLILPSLCDERTESGNTENTQCLSQLL